MERVKAATRELQLKGIIDTSGRRIRKDMPADIVIAGPASELLAHCKL